MAVMEIVFLPSDLNPSSGQNVLYSGAIEHSELLVECTIRDESLFEGVY